MQCRKSRSESLSWGRGYREEAKDRNLAERRSVLSVLCSHKGAKRGTIAIPLPYHLHSVSTGVYRGAKGECHGQALGPVITVSPRTLNRAHVIPRT
eukprot:434916-Hanusia_phi.AAC.1